MASQGSPAPSPALDSNQRKALYAEWWGAEARSCYFARLGARFSRIHQIITGSSLILSSGAFAAIAADPHVQGFIWAKLGLPAVTAVINGFSLVRQYSKRAYDCSELYFKWSKVAAECRDLWFDMYDPLAPKRWKAILEKGPEISKSVVHSLGTYHHLMKKCEDQAEMELKRYFA